MLNWFTVRFFLLLLKFDTQVQFSSVPWPWPWLVGGTWGTIQQRSSSSLFCRRPLWAVLVWAGMSIFDAVHQAFPLPYHSVQGALKDGFGEAVVECDMPKPRATAKIVSIPMEYCLKKKQKKHVMAGAILQIYINWWIIKQTWSIRMLGSGEMTVLPE